MRTHLFAYAAQATDQLDSGKIELCICPEKDPPAQMVCASVVHWSKNVALGLGKNAFVNLVATNLLQMQPTPVPSLCLKTLFQIVVMKSIVMNILE